VSWRPDDGQRLFGLLVAWDGDIAKVKRGIRIHLVPRNQLTWERG
jgi:hypothetical protein